MSMKGAGNSNHIRLLIWRISNFRRDWCWRYSRHDRRRRRRRHRLVPFVVQHVRDIIFDDNVFDVTCQNMKVCILICWFNVWHVILILVLLTILLLKLSVVNMSSFEWLSVKIDHFNQITCYPEVVVAIIDYFEKVREIVRSIDRYWIQNLFFQTKLYIGNLGDDGRVTSDDLRPLFEQFGNVTECECIKNYA